MKSTGVHVALLRGINVGGKNKLPMDDLAAMFATAGCTDVRTYIQSGNVVFAAGAKIVARLPAAIASAVERRFGFAPPLVLRSAAELAAARKANPYDVRGADEKALHVAFLADAPSPAAIASLAPDRSPPDQFCVRGRNVYLRLPNGVARSKLTNAWFDRQLQTVSTIRNWRTVLELLAMVGGT